MKGIVFKITNSECRWPCCLFEEQSGPPSTEFKSVEDLIVLISTIRFSLQVFLQTSWFLTVHPLFLKNIDLQIEVFHSYMLEYFLNYLERNMVTSWLGLINCSLLVIQWMRNSSHLGNYQSQSAQSGRSSHLMNFLLTSRCSKFKTYVTESSLSISTHGLGMHLF